MGTATPDTRHGEHHVLPEVIRIHPRQTPAVTERPKLASSADPISLARMSNAAGVSPLYNVSVLQRQPRSRTELVSFSKDVFLSLLESNGGAYRNRTDDILLAKQALSQLS
jgi:hypothetical protein